VLGPTGRQTEMLERLAAGCSHREIASRVFISPRTVENCATSILAKLGVMSREDVAAALGVTPQIE
jgi:DNA-binding NarL/FixJ family response regulator